MVALNDSTRELVFKRRQSDSGWGWAFAYLIPFVGFYHAWTRRTITPFAFYLGICIVTGFVFGLSDTYENMNESQRETATEAISLIALVPAVKLGINRDHKAALENKF